MSGLCLGWTPSLPRGRQPGMERDRNHHRSAGAGEQGPRVRWGPRENSVEWGGARRGFVEGGSGPESG